MYKGRPAKSPEIGRSLPHTWEVLWNLPFVLCNKKVIWSEKVTPKLYHNPHSQTGTSLTRYCISSNKCPSSNRHHPLVLMPPGAMSLKIQVVFFFFPCPSRLCELIGFSESRDVFCLSQANSTARCRQCFVAEFFQVYIVFLVVAIFAKTECYSPSNLLVCSAMCRTSVTYQLSTCRKWYVHHSIILWSF